MGTGRPVLITRRAACSRNSGVYIRRMPDIRTSFPRDQQPHQSGVHHQESTQGRSPMVSIRHIEAMSGPTAPTQPFDHVGDPRSVPSANTTARPTTHRAPQPRFLSTRRILRTLQTSTGGEVLGIRPNEIRRFTGRVVFVTVPILFASLRTSYGFDDDAENKPLTGGRCGIAAFCRDCADRPPHSRLCTSHAPTRTRRRCTRPSDHALVDMRSRPPPCEPTPGSTTWL